MKLRLRSLETKETTRIEVPTPCSLHHLKQLISQTLPSYSSPSSIHLSLNRKDQLVTSSSPQDPLHSLGITPGDLIFFTLNPNAFSPQDTPIPKKQQTLILDTQNNHNLTKMEINDEEQHASSVNESSSLQDPPNPNSQPTLISDSPKNQNLESNMEIDDEKEHVSVAKSFSVPGFLRKVFTDELGDATATAPNHKLLVIAVHAVLLESGFISEMGFQLPQVWVCPSLSYTLPGINDAVVVKFQSIGNFFTIYGCLTNGKGAHFVTADEKHLVPFLNVVWANCGSSSNSSSTLTRPGDEVFKFWRTVKDKLAFPLLIDLCEKAGLDLPPCFARLPTEIKLKVFELLPGSDIAKVACVCSELRYLTSSDDLWKKKFRENFGSRHKFEGNWKEMFGKYWSLRRERMVTSNVGLVRSAFSPRRFPPPVIGGNHDIWPQGLDPLAPLLGPFRASRERANQQWRDPLLPYCNLGGGHNLP